jgi:hypothetical protein
MRRSPAMPVLALKREPQRKMFYATIHVMPVEEWRIEAETVEEARELMNNGQAERTHCRLHYQGFPVVLRC